MSPDEFSRRLATRNRLSLRSPIPIKRAIRSLRDLRDDRTLYFLGGCGLVKTKGLVSWVRTPEGDELLKEFENV